MFCGSGDNVNTFVCFLYSSEFKLVQFVSLSLTTGLHSSRPDLKKPTTLNERLGNTHKSASRLTDTSLSPSPIRVARLPFLLRHEVTVAVSVLMSPLRWGFPPNRWACRIGVCLTSPPLTADVNVTGARIVAECRTAGESISGAL